MKYGHTLEIIRGYEPSTTSVILAIFKGNEVEHAFGYIDINYYDVLLEKNRGKTDE